MQNQFRYLRNPRLWQFASACYWLTLFVATHMPIDRRLLSGGRVDKLAHIAAFAALTALLATTWQVSAGRLNGRHLWWVWFAVVIYGAFEELTQPFVGRQASVWDWVADITGATLGLLLFAMFRNRKM